MNIKLSQLVMLLISILIGMTLSELVLRKIIPIEEKFYELDDKSIYRIKPNAIKWFEHLKENGGAKIEVTSNSMGFRGEEIESDATYKKIIIYGDSFIEGEYSKTENTFVEKLEKKLKSELHGQIEVINAGVNGYGPDQILRKLEDDNKRLHPNLIVVAIFADNDFGDIIRNKMYRIGKDENLEINNYRLSKRVKKQFKQQNRIAIIRIIKKAYWRFKNRLKRKSKYEKKSSNQFGKWLKECKEEYENYILLGDNEIKQLNYDHIDADMLVDPDSESSVYKLKLMKKILKKISEKARSLGVQTAILIIPSPVDVCENYDYDITSETYEKYNPRTLSDSIVKISDEIEIPYLNLFDIYSNNNPNDMYFHHGDNHWNDKGQDLAAEYFKEFLIKRELI